MGSYIPCDSIILTHVEFLPNTTDVGLLKKGLEGMGFRVQETRTGLSFSKGYREQGSYNKNTGSLTLPNTVDGNKVKVAYSKEVVNEQAEEQGWKVDWEYDEEGNPATDVLKSGW